MKNDNFQKISEIMFKYKNLILFLDKMIVSDFLIWLMTGLIAMYPARRLVKYWDNRRCFN